MIEVFDLNECMNSKQRSFAENVADKALQALALPRTVDVTVSIVSAEEIRQLNAEQREIDKVTDVLSFPMLFFEKPMDEQAFFEDEVATQNPETGNLFLGDIVLCFDRAKEQALEYGHSLEREIAFLIVHSLLHLVGYDHMTEEEEQEMFARQEEILITLNILR